MRRYKFEKDFDTQLKRIVKTPAEIKLIKKSAAITSSCVKIIERGLKRKNVTEKQLAGMIDRNIKRQKAGLAFPTIVTCGRRAVYIHAKPTNKRIQGLGYADFGAKYKGYCTDMTVPFVKGDIGKDERQILDATLSVYKRLVKSARAGSLCWKMQDEFEKLLAARSYKVRHSVGHGLGRDIHELPSLTKIRHRKTKDKRRQRRLNAWKNRVWPGMKKLKFQPGMVFTIEPGIYVRGIGGCRLENDFLMTKHGAKQLTHSKLLIIQQTV